MDDGSGHGFDILCAALGVDPCTQLAASLDVRIDARGGLVTYAHGRTSVDNLFAFGDVVSALDQISVAVWQGAIAVTTVHNSLLATAV